MIITLSLIAVILTTIGQLSLKYASLRDKKSYLSFGYFCFIVVIIASYYLMKIIELKYFTIVMSLNYLTVFIFSALLFKENVNKEKVLGMILVISGIIIFSIK